jgi:alpha-glucosidase (family GH31 glycosyl hydrolase)
MTFGDATKYEFLLGKDLLVAPVYKPEDKRDSIYLPEGKWFDFWDGTEYQGKNMLMNYIAPLDKLPLFVRTGAILPMYPAMMYDWERPTDTLTLHVYPSGKSAFTMYEDDGLTREHRQGEYATTDFECSATDKQIDFTIHAAKGDFNGRLKERAYLVDLHITSLPKSIYFNETKIQKLKTSDKLANVTTAWFYNPYEKNGTIHIKTETVSTDIISSLKIEF